MIGVIRGDTSAIFKLWAPCVIGSITAPNISGYQKGTLMLGAT